MTKVGIIDESKERKNFISKKKPKSKNVETGSSDLEKVSAQRSRESTVKKEKKDQGNAKKDSTDTMEVKNDIGDHCKPALSSFRIQRLNH